MLMLVYNFGVECQYGRAAKSSPVSHNSVERTLGVNHQDNSDIDHHQLLLGDRASMARLDRKLEEASRERDKCHLVLETDVLVPVLPSQARSA